MQQWQYRMIDLNDLPRKTDEISVLNGAGQEGWELVAITVNCLAFLKRSMTAASSPGRRRRTVPPPPSGIE